jgi:hypothetical protein
MIMNTVQVYCYACFIDVPDVDVATEMVVQPDGSYLWDMTNPDVAVKVGDLYAHAGFNAEHVTEIKVLS